MTSRPPRIEDLNRPAVLEQPAPPADEGWQRRLDVLAERHRVPGAALGILRMRERSDDELVEAAHGVLNTGTGVMTTSDSLFGLGSITKVWTATLVMQLVEEGLLDLDAPIIDVLPELRLADPAATKHMTIRQLLTHTSGIDGDIFTDTGRGDDCLQKYVARLEEAAQNHPPGATWSYSNSGFVVAGRVIETLTGSTWDQALRERLLVPLELPRTVTLPEEALPHRTAIGHILGGVAASPVRVWTLPRSLGPAALVSSTVADVLRFARLHLAGGATSGARQVLTAESVRAMADEHADLPDKLTFGDSWGLGWTRFDWDGHRLIGHDGGICGQAAFLRLLPEAGLAVVLLTNGGDARRLREDLFREIFAELVGVRMPPPLVPPGEPVTVDTGRHTGRYERAGARLDVFERDSTPVLKVTTTGPFADVEPIQELPMTPVDTSGHLYAVRQPPTSTWQPVTFYKLPDGRRYLHFNGRATPKV
jgi:CubicO group peptidase (beta-lactamase class C family)